MYGAMARVVIRIVVYRYETVRRHIFRNAVAQGKLHTSRSAATILKNIPFFSVCSLRQQQPIVKCKIPMVNQHPMQANDPTLTNGTALPMKHSMLDKLKFFNKEKMDRSSKIHISKHTSSSSGISSARSEHSDSSFSLNESVGSQSTSRASSLPAPSIHSKKPEIPLAKSKQKLLAMAPKSSSRDALNCKKLDKKERSTEMLNDKRTSRTHHTKNPAECKLKVSSVTKPVVQSPAGSPRPPNVPTITSIPKPMAAIKGTTKPALAPQKTVQNVVDVKDEACISSANQTISISQERSKATAANNNNSNELVNQQTNPMHNHYQLQQQQQHQLSQQNVSQMNDSIHSKSTHVSSSTGPMSTTSSCESIPMRHATVSRSNKFPVSNHRKMPAINGMDLPNGMNRVPSNRSLASSQSTASSDGSNTKYMMEPSKLMHSVNDIIYEDEKQKAISPMRPMFRSYSSHLTLPQRSGVRGQHRTIQEYNDDVAQGYCSESDTMRKASVRYTDIENGYMSEGGGRTIINANMNKHHKIFVGLMKAGAQLPATIEER